MHYLTPTAYASSNVKDASTDADALAGLDSPQMIALRLQTRGGVDGIGRWKDGAEEVRIAPRQDEKHAARLGALFNQKAILEYLPDEQGPDQRHIYEGIGKHKTLKDITKMVSPVSEYHTVTKDGDIHIIFQGGSPAKEIDGALPSVSNGYATFIGHEDRAKAAEVFNKILKDKRDADAA